MRVLVMLILVAALGAPSFAGADSPIRVTASIFPIASIVREIVGDRAIVTTIVPPGADPHHFELTPSKVRAIYEADVVFMIGGHFDEWAADVRIEERVQPIVIRFYQAFGDSLIPLGDSFNPHFWLDPFFARTMGIAINAVLGAADSKNCDYYRSRTLAFCSRIDSLHTSAGARLRESGFTDFVSLHPAWSYFARRYGLKEIDTIEISHDQEPSARHIAAVIGKMRHAKTGFILAEEFTNVDLAEAVASQTGAEVILLDPMGSTDRPGRDSYFRLIDYNVSLLEKAAGTYSGN
ncbi:MAG: metal ABC transporter substrate-binding protein [Candidatus Eisenbacteria bacterium]